VTGKRQRIVQCARLAAIAQLRQQADAVTRCGRSMDEDVLAYELRRSIN